MNILTYNAGYRKVGAYPATLTKTELTRMATQSIPDSSLDTQPTKVITCTDGTEILVDADDYPILSRHNWYINYSGKKPYCITKLKTDLSTIWRCIFMHHMILGGGSQTDHIDGNTLNNTKGNLRKADSQQNGWNTKKRSRTCNGKAPSSQYKGVSKYVNAKGDTLWRVIFILTRKGEKPVRHFRKSGFKTEVAAALAYNEEVVKYRGEWALLNEITPQSNVGKPE